jgi:Arm DNA-binding domain
MPKRSALLISTARQVESAKGPVGRKIVAEYRVDGTPNLVLRVARSGQRSWTYVMKRPKTGRWHKYRIGPYPSVTLATARDETVRLRRAILDGEDPFETRLAGHGTLTMETLGAIFIKRHAKEHKRSWPEDERKLKVDINPLLGKMRADLVTKTDIVGLVDAIKDRGAPISDQSNTEPAPQAVQLGNGGRLR